MTNALFGIENWAHAGTLTASAAASSLGVTQLQNDHGATSTSWQTPGGTTTAWLQLDAGGAADWGALGVFNTNLTPTASLRWRLSNDPGFGTSLYDSGPLFGTVAPGYRQSVHVLPASVSARYLRLDLADPFSIEGLLRLGQLYTGSALRPRRNIGFESSFQRSAEITTLTTRGGQTFPSLRFARRSWRLTLPSLHPDEVWSLTQALQIAAEDGQNVLFVPAPDGTTTARDAVFGTLAGPTPVTWPARSPALRAWAATITERL